MRLLASTYLLLALIKLSSGYSLSRFACSQSSTIQIADHAPFRDFGEMAVGFRYSVVVKRDPPLPKALESSHLLAHPMRPALRNSEVLAQTKQHIILIQDGAKYHTSRAMQEFLATMR